MKSMDFPALPVDGGHGLLAVGLAVQAVARVFQVKAQSHRNRVVIFNQQEVFVHGWPVPHAQGVCTIGKRLEQSA